MYIWEWELRLLECGVPTSAPNPVPQTLNPMEASKGFMALWGFAVKVGKSGGFRGKRERRGEKRKKGEGKKVPG